VALAGVGPGCQDARPSPKERPHDGRFRPVFEMAARPFETIADDIEIPEDERARLLDPKRAATVTCPVHRDGVERVRDAEGTRGLFP
jgi:hypothetical protein